MTGRNVFVGFVGEHPDTAIPASAPYQSPLSLNLIARLATWVAL
jgi:hypothetical protein